jgi:predicted transposase/invertase (TIGR01784 family)
MLNGLFGETFDPALVEITQDNAKFVNEQLEIIEGDLFLRITKPPVRPYLFHIEFQTGEDDTMAIRVLRYDLDKAIENQRLTGDKHEIILYMPQSLVIHVEAHENIPDEYKAIIVFADGDTKAFKVPVLKYWKLSDEYLIENNLFPLLPLQIFLLRAELDKLTKNNDNQAKQAAILKARDIAERIANEAAELNKNEKLINDDFKRVLVAISNLFEHLNNRYEVDKNMNSEVITMTELIFDDTAYQRGEHKGKREKAVEMAKKMLIKNKPIEEIIEFTGLTKKDIKEIQKTL